MGNTDLNLNSLVSRSKDQVSSVLDDETVILNVKTGKYFNLKEVGKRIWELIEKPTPIATIVQEIFSEYEVDLEKCQGDTLNLVTSLHEAGLVVVSEDAAPND